jgi:hypothetical protein
MLKEKSPLACWGRRDFKSPRVYFSLPHQPRKRKKKYQKKEKEKEKRR